MQQVFAGSDSEAGAMRIAEPFGMTISPVSSVPRKFSLDGERTCTEYFDTRTKTIVLMTRPLIVDPSEVESTVPSGDTATPKRSRRLFVVA